MNNYDLWLSVFVNSSQSADQLLKFDVLCRLPQHQVIGYVTCDLDETSTKVEFYHHSQSYSDYLDSESRSREKHSFRSNERSLVTNVITRND